MEGMQLYVCTVLYMFVFVGAYVWSKIPDIMLLQPMLRSLEPVGAEVF